MAILLASTAASVAASAATSAVIVRASIAPAFTGAAMVVDNSGQRPLHSMTAVAAVSATAPLPPHPAALRRCLGHHHHRNRCRVAVLR